MIPRTHVGRAGSNPLRIGLDLVLPRPCPGCGRPGPWCVACADTLAGRARLVQLPDATLDAAAGTVLPPARALARYAGPPRQAILAGKERGRADLPPILGEAVGRALIRLIRIAVIPDELWIVPAPSRRSAARRRGGDPVAAMATSAARLLAENGVACGVAPCLFTSGRAQDSVGLDAAARAANLAGRVRFRSSAAPGRGASVVLLDDVLTTGATVWASVRTLSEVSVPVAAVLTVATAAPWRSRR